MGFCATDDAWAHGLVTTVTALLSGNSPRVAQSSSCNPYVILTIILNVGSRESRVTDEETGLWRDPPRSHTSGQGQR